VRRFAVLLFIGNLLFSTIGSSFTVAQSQSPTSQGESQATTKTKKTITKKTAAKFAAKTPTSKPATKKSAASSSRKTSAVANKKKHKPVSPRVWRVRRAFVASASLRPMA
jgi:hypothetical protein